MLFTRVLGSVPVQAKPNGMRQGRCDKAAAGTAATTRRLLGLAPAAFVSILSAPIEG